MTYFEVRSCFGLVRSCGSIPEIARNGRTVYLQIHCNCSTLLVVFLSVLFYFRRMNKSQQLMHIYITIIISVDSKMAVMLLVIMVVERTRCLQLPSVSCCQLSSIS